MQDITIKKATFIYAISKYTLTICNLVFTIILARIITPEEYGVIAITSVFTTFFSLFSDMGIGAGIIQNKKLTLKDINSIFAFTVYLSLFLCTIFVFFSYGMSWFFQKSIYGELGIFLGASLLFNTLNLVPNALLIKNKRFMLIGVRNFICTVGTSVIAVLLAFAGFGYYSLVIQSLLSSIILVICNIASNKISFQFLFTLHSIKKIRSYAGYQFGFSFINYFARNLDKLLVGFFMGNAALGCYDKAYKLMMYPVGNLTNVITPVLHPILSDYQSDVEYIYKKYKQIFKILSLIGIFLGIFCFFTSREIISIVFGEVWITSVPYFKALSVSIWFQLTSSSCGSIYQSIGNTKLMFKSCMLFVPIQIVMIIIGAIGKNLILMSWLVSFSFVIKFFIEYYFLIKKGIKAPLRKFYIEMIPDMMIAVILSAAMSFTIFISVKNIWLSFSLKFCLCLLVYMSVLILLKQHTYLVRILPDSLVLKFKKIMKKNKDSCFL